MSHLISLDAKLYRGTAGSSAATEVTTVADVSLKIKKTRAKINSRASHWALSKTTLKEAEVEITVPDNDSDAHLAALIAAYVADTPLAFKILDKASGKGLDADFDLVDMDRDEKLEDNVVYKFTLVPTYVSRYPAWV